jgi:hypothetical protein
MQELGVVGSLPASINVLPWQNRSVHKKTELSVLKALNKAAADVVNKWDLPKIPLGKAYRQLMIETRKIVSWQEPYR